MKTVILLSLAFLSCLSCSTDPNALPKNLPISTDQTTVPQVSQNFGMDGALFKVYQQQQASIANGLMDGGISAYTVRDGEGLISESTTYYRDEKKELPVKTKIIYLTGGSVDIYWLTEETVWVARDEYTHLFQKGKLMTSIRDGEVANITDAEKEEVSQIPVLGMKIITSPAANSEDS